MTITSGTPTPIQIAQQLEQRVIGQREAIQEIAVAIAKKLTGLRVGNVLMIGPSGTGKTTLLHAVEEMLAADPSLAVSSNVIRIHANVLGEEAERGHAGEGLLLRLIERARRRLGSGASVELLIEQASHGLVFVDEVDKIRTVVGGQPNVSGIRAQEALLTLIENEAVPLRLPDWADGATVQIDSRSILFVCVGAFEGLHDAVYHRVTAGRDRGALKPVTVVEDGRVRNELQFSLREWLKSEDLFEYGVSPQFLSRFDAVVLLDALGEEDLLRIFTQGQESALRQSQTYFARLGIRLQLTPDACRRIAREASRQPRLGARALKEIFRRVIRPFEYDPRGTAAEDGKIVIDVAEVDRALAAFRAQNDAAAG
ncbi:MAG: AAA family ATPase [Vicinamibacteria bacterium]|nr:AAA family ATPase [Vicinamibacteria bacterium]